MSTLNDLSDPLLAGFARYQARYYGSDSVYTELNAGQHPTTLVIGCCDSRVHPPALMDTAPGEMFVLRNVANIVPPHGMDSQHASVAAALEFAVFQLKVKRIIVLGHKHCGGIRALVNDSAPKNSHLGRWLNIVMTAKKAAKTIEHKNPNRSAYEICEQMAILVSLNNLLSYPWIAEQVATNQLQIDGWYFDMQTGTLLGYDPDEQDFISLVPRVQTLTTA